MKLFRMSKNIRSWHFSVVRDRNFLNGGYHFNEVGKSAKYKHRFKNHELPNRCLDDQNILMKGGICRPQYST